MDKDIIVSVYCPDCRGRFDIESEFIEEEEVIECDLCSAEIMILSEDPIRIKLYSSDDDF